MGGNSQANAMIPLSGSTVPVRKGAVYRQAGGTYVQTERPGSVYLKIGGENVQQVYYCLSHIPLGICKVSHGPCGTRLNRKERLRTPWQLEEPDFIAL